MLRLSQLYAHITHPQFVKTSFPTSTTASAECEKRGRKLFMSRVFRSTQKERPLELWSCPPRIESAWSNVCGSSVALKVEKRVVYVLASPNHQSEAFLSTSLLLDENQHATRACVLLLCCAWRRTYIPLPSCVILGSSLPRYYTLDARHQNASQSG